MMADLQSLESISQAPIAAQCARMNGSHSSFSSELSTVGFFQGSRSGMEGNRPTVENVLTVKKQARIHVC